MSSLRQEDADLGATSWRAMSALNAEALCTVVVFAPATPSRWAALRRVRRVDEEGPPR
jgi:hypothetical protein